MRINACPRSRRRRPRGPSIPLLTGTVLPLREGERKSPGAPLREDDRTGAGSDGGGSTEGPFTPGCSPRPCRRSGEAAHGVGRGPGPWLAFGCGWFFLCVFVFVFAPTLVIWETVGFRDLGGLPKFRHTVSLPSDDQSRE